MAKKPVDVEHKKVNTREIVIEKKYQRSVEERKAQFNHIMKNFDPRLVNDIKVSYRNGRYYCVDGQMTMTVLKARNGGKDLMVDCKVFYGLTELEEKELFVEQNGKQSGVSSADKMRAGFNYGDVEMVNLVRLCEMNGVLLSFDKARGKNKIVAHSAILAIWRECNDPSTFSKLLQIIKKAWDGDMDSWRNEILWGVWIFMKTYEGRYAEKVLIRRLSEVSPKTIIREAKISTASGKRKFAVQILNAYNKNTSKNRLPELL